MTSQTPQAPDPWYVSAFRGVYLTVYAHRDEADARRAAEFCARQLGLGPATHVLDLCCGAGRHQLQFARLGIPATGLDLSADLLTAARQSGVAGPLIHGDAREVALGDGSVDAVVNLFSSFGYFEREEDDLRVLREVRRVLRPRVASRASAVFDLMNPSFVRGNLVPESTESRNGYSIQSRRRIDEARRRILKAVEVTDGAGHRVAQYTESVRLYEPGEFDGLLAGAGLCVTGRYGDFDDRPFGEQSPRQIVVVGAC